VKEDQGRPPEKRAQADFRRAIGTGTSLRNARVGGPATHNIRRPQVPRQEAGLRTRQGGEVSRASEPSRTQGHSGCRCPDAKRPTQRPSRALT